MRQRLAAVLGMGLLVGLVSIPGLGHRAAAIGGVFDGPASAVQLPDPFVSYVVYGHLWAGRPSLWVSVDVPAAMDLRVQVGAPVLGRLRAYRIQAAVLGPELPLLPLPISVPSGLGGLLVLATPIDDAAAYHEPVTDTWSWIVADTTVRLPAGGRYYVVAWSASLTDGKAWIAIGEREDFGWRDLTGLRSVIESVRAFHEVGPDPRFLTLSKALYLAGISLLIACLALL